MKNFLKLTAIFACLALVFVACNEDDTVDGYVPNFPAIDAENVTVTRGDGKIRVVWTVPEEESITYSRISWSGADKGSEIIPVSSGTETTFTIGVDDEAGESGSPLPAGNYTIKIESMEGRYVGTGSWSSTESYSVYNVETYEGQYPVTTSIEHDNTNATITWGSFPDDCISVDVNYYKENEGKVVLTVVPANALAAETTLLESAVIDTKVTFTPSFLPEGAIEEDVVTLVEGGETAITISDSVKAIPKIQSALGGNMKLYVEWTVYQDLNISASTVQVYGSDGEPLGAPYTITYNEFDDASSVYGYTEETKDNLDVKNVYLYIDNTVLSTAAFEAGSNYTVQVVNTVAEASEPAVTEALYVYDNSTYGEAPKVKEVTHDGSSAVVVWDLSAMTGYGDEDANSSYNALYKIEVTYNTDKVITFTSEDTNHFSFECNLPDAKYDTDDASFTYKAYYRPEGAIETDEHLVSVPVTAAEEIPYPELAAPVGVELRSGYNEDTSSYLEVKWFDVDGVLGVANDAVVDALVFYTEDYKKLDALSAAIENSFLTGAVGADYTNADWTSIGWETTLPTPLSVVNFMGTTIEDFVKNETIINGATVTIGKAGDTSGVADGLVADKTYYVAVASINAAGQLNIKNLNNGDTVESLAEAWGVDLSKIDYDTYIQRIIKTYNADTFTSNEDNKKIFNEFTQTSISRNRTTATVAWDWNAATEADVVAVKVTEYTNNEDGKTTPTVETAKGSTTALTYVKAGTGNLSGHTAYFCPAALSGEVCGIERTEIVQECKLDIPYLDIPGSNMEMKVGVNEGTADNSTVELGEPYIATSWILANEDANVENISGYKMMYRTGTDEFVAAEGELLPNAREAIIAPAAPLTADVDYDVYISYVDLDGYTRPSTACGDAADGSEGSMKIKTYNKASYSTIQLPLDGTIEEVAYDGETMTLYWGNVPADCVGVIVTMTSGNRKGQSYGYEYILGEKTEVVDVEQGDTFTYRPYFRPSEIGEVIVPGEVSKLGCYLGESGADAPKLLEVPVSTAPTRAEITNITSSYVGESGAETPQITVTWDFPATELNRENILNETGSRYMYIYCYEDGATNYTYVNRMVVTDDTEYSYTVASDKLALDRTYTIYVATKNVNNVSYKSEIYDAIKTYVPASYDESMVPAILSAKSNTSNEIEVTWATEGMSEDLQNIYINYNLTTSEAFEPQLGAGAVPYESGVSKVSITADFRPTYVIQEESDDPDFVAPTPVVFYGSAVSFTSTDVEAQTLDYDIAYDGATYNIFTAKGLAAFADLVNGTSVYTGTVQTQGTITSWDSADGIIADVKLVSDIDLKDLDMGDVRTNWTPIADYYTLKSSQFKGTFDGNGYVISNLYINTGEESTQNRGLFGCVAAGGTVKNVILENVSLTLKGAVVLNSGGITGVLSASTVSNCEIRSGEFNFSPTGGVMSGGIAGVVSAGFTIENCINRANITATNQQVGGIAAYMNNTFGNIINCQNFGNITAAAYAGGISGYFFASGANNVETRGCANYGEITAAANVGGIAGSSRAGASTTVVNYIDCVNNGSVTCTGGSIGGIVGLALCSADGGVMNFTNCENNAAISGVGNNIGGIAGGNTKVDGGAVVITGCDNNGDITGTGSNIGGIIGITNGKGVLSKPLVSGNSSTSRNKNTANIKGSSNVGAIVGNLTAGSTIQYYDHYYGTVEGDTNVGGVVGNIVGEVIDCIDKTDPANAEANDADLREVSAGNWEIYTTKGLAAFADVVNGTSGFLLTTQNPAANAVVKGNIDFTDMSDTYVWTPIEQYKGTFDGGSEAGYTIKNLSIEADTDNQGLFASIVGGTVKNVSIENVNITSTANNVGAVVGHASMGATVQNCKAIVGKVTGVNYVGGIVGCNYGGAGGAYGSVVTGCTNMTKVFGAAYIGGVVGHNSPDASTTPCIVENCENTGKIVATANFIGGVVGYNQAPETRVITESAIITGCKNSGVLDLKSSYIGGIVGKNEFSGARVKESDNTGAIYGKSSIAGIAGGNISGATVTYCDNSAEVKATGSYIAGIVGENDDISNISNCNNTITGNIYGIGTDSYVDGISGAGIMVGNVVFNNNYANITTNAAPDPDLEFDGGIYKIWSPEGLIAFADLVNGTPNSTGALVVGDGAAEFLTPNPTISGLVVADIDFEDIPYVQIVAYKGTFDGGNHTISNIVINTTAGKAGLFSSTEEGAVIKNVKLSNFNLTSTVNVAGAIVGNAIGTTITDCVVESGTITGGTNIGGFAGATYHSTFRNCINNADVVSTYSSNSTTAGVGGFVGTMGINNVLDKNATERTMIENCVNNGSVTSDAAYTAGMVGSFYCNAGAPYGYTITNCTNNGTIQSTSGPVGGMAAYVRADAEGLILITESTNNGTIVSGGVNVGGIIGYATSIGVEVSHCTNGKTGTVTSTNSAKGMVGGLAGQMAGGSSLTYSTNYADVNGITAVGGVIGYKNTPTSVFNYNNNEGNVTGISNIGGIAGFGNAPLIGDATTRNYNSGTVSGKTNVGGIVGNNGAVLSNYINKGQVLVNGVEKNDEYGIAGLFEDTTLITNCEDQYESTYVPPVDMMISNEAELLAFVEAFKTAEAGVITNGTLTASFSLSAEWTPIVNYTGTFDGAGNTISGLVINGSTDEVGLFGSTIGATIKNLTLSDVNILSSAGKVGAIVGNAKEETTITDCSVRGSISGGNYVGGIAGYNSDSSIENCSNSIPVMGTDYVGGIAGYNQGETEEGSLISNCSNSAEISGASCVGGIAGRNYLVATVSGSTNTGAIVASATRAGGIVGHNCPNATYGGTTVENCTNNGPIDGTSDVGGIVGENQFNENIAYVKGCSNYATVTGSDANIGGIVGNNTGTSVMEGSVSDYGVNYGNVTGTSEATSVGGIVGAANNGTISYFTNYGVVTVNGAASNSTNGVYGSTASAAIVSCYDGYVDLEATTLDIKMMGSNYSIYTAKGLVAYAQIVNGTLSSVDGLESEGTVTAVTEPNTSAGAILQKDVDLDGIAWTPIADFANNNVKFTGKFNGNGNTISNLTIDSESAYQGLFGFASGATITGVKLANLSMTLNGSVDLYSGGIVGKADASEISNCEVSSGAITTATTGVNSYVGGIVGVITTSTVENCINRANVTGTTRSVAGIVGANTNSVISIKGCYNYGNITSGDLYVSGIVGFLQAAGGSWVEDCHNEGVITGAEVGNVAGVVAYLRSMTATERAYIFACSNKGDVTAGAYTGGIAGFMAPNGGMITVANCENYSTVTGTENTGGIVAGQGNTAAELDIFKSTNSGAVIGTTNVGGIVGIISNKNSSIGTVGTGCVNTGSVTGTTAADATEISVTGGIVGNISAGIISSCVNSGLVTIDGAASNDINGIYGKNAGTVSEDCVDNYGVE